MARERRLWPRRIRRIVQSLTFLGFLLFVIVIPALAETRLRGDWWMRLSPFSALGSSISAWELLVPFWPALALFAGALLLGRYFCGWACPLGTSFDLADRIIGLFRNTPRRARERREAMQEAGRDFEHRSGRRAKYYLLVGSLVAAFAGVAAFGLFDPLSIAVRSYVLVVHSYASSGISSLLRAFGLFDLTRAARNVLMVETEPVFSLHVFTLAAFAGLLLLGIARKRFWCRYICPLGGLYALAGKPALTKRTATDACIECGRCAEACPMDCISPDGRRTLNDECILCLQCQPVCPTDAVRFFASTPSEQAEEVDLTRRGALGAVAAGAAAYPLYAIKPNSKMAKEDPLIRPPLAGRDLAQFMDKCLRCGQCMRACPTHVIQPAGLQAGIEGLWTPHLVPRLGYCIYECDACGKACPSGAIPRFNLPEKHASAMGLAFVDTTRCIPWRGWYRRQEEDWVADEHNCGVCEEVCPVPEKAIHFRRESVVPGQTRGGRGRAAAGEGQELRMPYVRKDRCVGCGFCEESCPVVGPAAVRVTGGFRELPSPPTEAGEAAARTADALPPAVDPLRIVSESKQTFTGADELWDYINGEGDRYLPFGFVRVTKAAYAADGSHLQVDLWEFEDGDGAYGAYTKDRQGEPIELGDMADQASALNGSLWARRGKYFLRAVDLGRTPPQQTRRLARRALETLGAPAAGPPQIVQQLPDDRIRSQTIVYMRDSAPLWELDLSDEYIPDGTFAVEQGAEGAYAAYDLREDEKPAGLLLIRYPSPARAEAAAGRLADLRAEWGHQRVQERPYPVFKAGENNYHVVGTSDAYLASAFYMPRTEPGVQLVREALE